MNSKIIVLSIAVIFVGIFAMPATMSLFAGQHTFTKGKDVDCRKCHEDIYEELNSPYSNVHWKTEYGAAKGANDVFSCRECHNVTLNFSSNFLNNVAGNSNGAHAAQTVSCLTCHGVPTYNPGYSASSNPWHKLANKYTKGPQSTVTTDATTCGQCHSDAVDPGETNVFIIKIPNELSNTNEAHTPFYQAAQNNSSVLKDANEACIGCHTHSNIKANWRRSVGMDIVINESVGGTYNINMTVNNSYNMTTTKSNNITADGTY